MSYTFNAPVTGTNFATGPTATQHAAVHSGTSDADEDIERDRSARRIAHIGGRYVIAAAGVGAILTAFFTNGFGLFQPSSPSPTISQGLGRTSPASPGGQSQPDRVPVMADLKLTAANFCTWKLGIHPMPLAGANPLKIRIDGRCNYPKDPNPVTDSPTGIYSVAQQDPSFAIAKLRDGTVVRLLCYTHGQVISDAIGNLSSVWLRIAFGNDQRGYVPDVNAGNYSTIELRHLGAGACP